MSQDEKQLWCDALKLIPSQWRAEFCRFTEEGEASDAFLEFLKSDEHCREACEMVLRGDQAMVGFLKAATELAELRGAAAS